MKGSGNAPPAFLIISKFLKPLDGPWVSRVHGWVPRRKTPSVPPRRQAAGTRESQFPSRRRAAIPSAPEAPARPGVFQPPRNRDQADSGFFRNPHSIPSAGRARQSVVPASKPARKKPSRESSFPRKTSGRLPERFASTPLLRATPGMVKGNSAPALFAHEFERSFSHGLPLDSQPASRFPSIHARFTHHLQLPRHPRPAPRFDGIPRMGNRP